MLLSTNPSGEGNLEDVINVEQTSGKTGLKCSFVDIVKKRAGVYTTSVKTKYAVHVTDVCCVVIDHWFLIATSTGGRCPRERKPIENKTGVAQSHHLVSLPLLCVLCSHQSVSGRERRMPFYHYISFFVTWPRYSNVLEYSLL